MLTDPARHRTVVAWFDEHGNRLPDAPPYAYRPRYLTTDRHKKLVGEAMSLRAKLAEEYRSLIGAR